MFGESSSVALAAVASPLLEGMLLELPTLRELGRSRSNPEFVVAGTAAVGFGLPSFNNTSLPAVAPAAAAARAPVTLYHIRGANCSGGHVQTVSLSVSILLGPESELAPLETYPFRGAEVRVGTDLATAAATSAEAAATPSAAPCFIGYLGGLLPLAAVPKRGRASVRLDPPDPFGFSPLLLPLPPAARRNLRWFEVIFFADPDERIRDVLAAPPVAIYRSTGQEGSLALDASNLACVAGETLLSCLFGGAMFGLIPGPRKEGEPRAGDGGVLLVPTLLLGDGSLVARDRTPLVLQSIARF